MCPRIKSKLTQFSIYRNLYSLNGEATGEARVLLSSTKLVALCKPNGKLRPIAMGDALRKLAMTLLCKVHREEFDGFFTAPLKPGYAGGSAGGGPAIAARSRPVHPGLTWYGRATAAAPGEILLEGFKCVRVERETSFTSSSRKIAKKHGRYKVTEGRLSIHRYATSSERPWDPHRCPITYIKPSGAVD